MKRTASLTFLPLHLCLSRPGEPSHRNQSCVDERSSDAAGSAAERPMTCLSEDDASRRLSGRDQCDPWSYGAEPGVDAWRPPHNCQTQDASLLSSLRQCSFCHRSLDHYDIFMYRGDKAFCSLQCRQHQILLDHRHVEFKQAGKRFSMVPNLEPAGFPGARSCWIPEANNHFSGHTMNASQSGPLTLLSILRPLDESRSMVDYRD